MPAIASKALIKMMELSRTAAFVQMVNTHGLLYGGKSGIFFKVPTVPMGTACFVQIVILKLSSDAIAHQIKESKRR